MSPLNSLYSPRLALNLWSFSLKLPSSWDYRLPDPAKIQHLYNKQNPVPSSGVLSSPSSTPAQLPPCCPFDILSTLPAPGSFNSFWTSGTALENFSSNDTLSVKTYFLHLYFTRACATPSVAGSHHCLPDPMIKFHKIRSCIFSMPRTGSGMKYIPEKYLLSEIQIISAKI